VKILKASIMAFAFGLGISTGLALLIATARASNLADPGVIEAKAFRLVDENGLTRGGWGVRDGIVVFTCFDVKGKPRLNMSSSDFSQIRFLGPDGDPSLRLTDDKKIGSELRLFDEFGKARIIANATGPQAAISLFADFQTPGIRLHSSSRASGMEIWKAAEDIYWRQATDIVNDSKAHDK
jgi:hypothetical protein